MVATLYPHGIVVVWVFGPPQVFFDRRVWHSTSAPTAAFNEPERWSYTERWAAAAAATGGGWPGNASRSGSADGWAVGAVADNWIADLPLHPVCSSGSGGDGGGDGGGSGCFPVIGPPPAGAAAAAESNAPGGGLVFWPAGWLARAASMLLHLAQLSRPVTQHRPPTAQRPVSAWRLRPS